jgi:glycyl-tRNA synthetase
VATPTEKPSISKGGTDFDKIVNLCLRRGLLFPNSDIYGSMAGFFDYGPYGVELKRNIEGSWWKNFVQDRADIVGMDGTIISHPMVWKASGHADAFNDPLVDCKKCKSRFRADHLVEDELKISVDGLSLEALQELINKHKLVCPKCKGELTVVRVFNLMFRTHVGPVEDESSIAYLRPETAQLIFADFKLIQASSRKQLPFGIAQIGKAFRNEIAPRNFVFRCREFSQMEIEFFIHPAKINDCPLLGAQHRELEAFFYTAEMQEKQTQHQKMKIGDALKKGIIKTQWHAYWIAEIVKWFISLGLRPENMRVRQHVPTELSHYSTETWDLEYNYPWGWKELQGIANRTDFDLKQHAKFSGKDLSYFDVATGEKVIPYVIEPSTGVDRAFLTVLLDAFEERKEKEGSAIVLHLSPKIAPVKVAVFPLMKKDGLGEKAREIFESLKKMFATEYDEAGSIGKRYARHDEIGTPYCITVDYETLEEGASRGTVTVRERDSGKQERVPIETLGAFLAQRL